MLLDPQLWLPDPALLLPPDAALLLAEQEQQEAALTSWALHPSRLAEAQPLPMRMIPLSF